MWWVGFSSGPRYSILISLTVLLHCGVPVLTVHVLIIVTNSMSMTEGTLVDAISSTVAFGTIGGRHCNLSEKVSTVLSLLGKILGHDVAESLEFPLEGSDILIKGLEELRIGRLGARDFSNEFHRLREVIVSI